MSRILQGELVGYFIVAKDQAPSVLSLGSLMYIVCSAKQLTRVVAAGIVLLMNDLATASAATTTDTLPFFVYGTLRHGEGNYYGRLAGRTVREALGSTSGFLMLGRRSQFPFALAASEDYTITGEVMWIEPELYDGVMASMDDLEGYVPGRDWNLYDRQVVTVETAEGPVKAWMYVSLLPVEYFIENETPVIPSGDWFEAR